MNSQSPIPAIQHVLNRRLDIRLAILFGSLPKGAARSDSDVDLAVLSSGPLSAEEITTLIGEIADAVGRPVDLVDLSLVGEPLLGQILQGQRILGSDEQHARLLTKHLIDQADYGPLQERILKERRDAWTK